MKNILTIFFSSTCWISISSAQSVEFITKISADQYSTVYETHDKGFFVLSNASYFVKPWGVYQSESYCQKLDSNGIVKWTWNKSHPPVHYFDYVNVLIDSSGYYLICGSDVDTSSFQIVAPHTIIYKLDNNFNTVWIKKFPIDSIADAIFDACLIKDGNIILMSQNHLTKIDSASDTLWVKDYHLQTSSFLKLVSTSDSGFCVFYYSYLYSGISYTHFNSNGDSITSGGFPFHLIGRISKSINDEFVFAGNDTTGQRTFVKIDSSLSIVQTKPIYGNYYTPQFLDSNRYAILSSPGFSYLVADSTINFIDTIQYAGNDGNLTTDSVLSVLYTSDKGLILSGYIDKFYIGMGNTYDTAIVLKYDYAFTLLVTNITPQAIDPIDNEQLIVFPNPGNNNLNLKSNYEWRNADLEIYNGLGIKFKTYPKINGKTFSIDAPVENGIYFGKISDNFNTKKFRFMVQRHK